MKLTLKNLLAMLAQAERPAPEQVMTTKLLRKTISFNKDEWTVLFPDWPGIKFKVGKAVEIVRAGEKARKAEVPDAVCKRLGAGTGDRLYVTRRDGKFFLKRVDLAELPAVMPGFYVFDSFTDTTVVRSFQSAPDLDAISPGCLRGILEAAGKFRYDPVAPFRKMEGLLGYLARREFAGGLTADDKEWVRSYVADLAAKQGEDGSWQKAVPATALNIMQLLDLGATREDPGVRKAVDWLLARPEPEGFPALWMSSDRFLKSFNRWKAGGGKGQRGRNTPETDKKEFREHRDTFGVAGYCEARFTWTSGVVLGALLRCGLHQHERVVRGINSLLGLGGQAAGWCGCRYFYAGWRVALDDRPTDLDRVPMPQANQAHSWNWLMTAEEIGKWVSPWGERPGLDVGHGRSLVSGAVSDTGSCARVVLRGLSYHPDFHGSNLEAILSLRCIAHQYHQGTWRVHYPSFLFSILERCRHPLSAFALLRSTPVFIRQQRPDGLWDEAGGAPLPGTPEEAPPTPEQRSFQILRALHAHGLLKDLLPRKAAGRGSSPSKRRAKTSA